MRFKTPQAFKIVLATFIILWGISLHAAKIHVSFSHFPKANYKLILHFGEKEFLDLQGQLDARGQATLKLRKNASEYQGCADLVLSDSIRIPFILNGVTLSMSSGAAVPDWSNLQFEQSPENDFLVTNQEELDSLSSSLHYAARYLEIKHLLDTLSNYKNLSDAVISQLRTSSMNRVDMRALYSSGMWTPLITAWAQMEAKRVQNDTLFIKDTRALMVISKPNMILNEFMNTFIRICNEESWGYVKDETVNIVYQSGALHHPTGLLAETMKPMGVQFGAEAPDFLIDSLSHRKMSKYKGDRILLFFYETGCPHCEAQEKILIPKYEQLKSSGVHLISIASDYLPDLFQETAAKFPWKDKVRDPDYNIFLPYGVTEAPTYIFIDEDGKVKGRYSTLERTHLLPQPKQ